MKWLVFETEQEAIDYSHNVAVRHGHGKPENTIQYWWAWKQTVDNKWAVQCPEGTETPEIGEINE